MAVSQCPKCKNYLVDYAWTKTKSNKNWLKHLQKGWHTCPNSTWKKKIVQKEDTQWYRNSYTYDPWNGNKEMKARFDIKYAAATAWCDDCNDAYYLKLPCIHHLTDNARDQKRYAIWKSEKKKIIIEPDHKQKGL